MKHIYLILITALCILTATSVSSAQDVRTLETKVADILAMMPAGDAGQMNKAMDEIIGLGEDGFAQIAELITPTGEGDNSAAKFAINSLARYANQHGTEEKRDFTEKNIIKTLKKADNNEVKAFFMRQLQLVGENASVEAVKGYLANEALCDPAARVLNSINNDDAIQAFINALPNAEGKCAKVIVKNLGELKVSAANVAIIAKASSEDLNLKKVSLAALANIGDAASYNTLYNAAKAVKFNYEATNATAAFISYADQLGAEGEDKLCKKACNAIIKNSKEVSQLHNSSSAYSILANYFGTEAIPGLFKAFNNSDKAYRYSILNIVEKTGDIAVTKLWIAKAKDSAPEQKAEIIEMLGRRGDMSAVAYITSEINNSPNATVAQASMEALPMLDKEIALSTISNYIISGGSETIIAEKTLLYIIDKKHLDILAKEIDGASDLSKASVINIIGAKAGKCYFEKVYGYTSSSSADVKKASFSALKNVSSEKNIDELLKLLFATNDAENVANVQNALIAAASEIEDEEERSAKFLSALESTSEKEKITEILPKLGGEKALAAVTELFSSSDKNIKDAAFNALVTWKDYSASTSLYQICKTAKGDYKSGAFRGFVRQISKSDLQADQKLLHMRNIMPYAESRDEKASVLKAVADIKTFLALIFVSNYLDDSSLQSIAANTAMAIALPSNGKKVGLYGDIVREILEKTIDKLRGSEARYDKEKIRKYLGDMPKEAGLTSMFNGKDLSGWHGYVTNPIKLAKMGKKELARKQAEANIKMHENWSVKNGTIAFSGKGHNLLSDKLYGDFEMIVDWRITKKGDSGLYLRGTPQIQIWDTSRVEVGAQVGSGGLYNNKVHPSKPLLVADNPVGEWNTFHITMMGEKVTVYLNGELVVDNVTLENYWDRRLPIFPEGTIELQAHGTDLAFRDIYVREINEKEYNLTEEEKAEGFVSLFNGRNLDGWVGNKVNYIVEDGNFASRPKKNYRGSGNIFTEKEYSDFIFRFEFKLTPGANNGLGIRCPLKGDGAYEGIELQILDDTAPVYANLAPYQYHGSVYGTMAAKRGHLKPVGEWNYEEVIVKGTSIKVILNGTVILDGDIADARDNGTLDKKDHPGLKREKGHIGFLGHGNVLDFRNIRIKDLSK
jgi:HEAT repeat protein